MFKGSLMLKTLKNAAIDGAFHENETLKSYIKIMFVNIPLQSGKFTADGAADPG